MSIENTENQIFSGLILLTGEDKPGLANSFFEALSPFAVSIIDIDQIIISGRLILTVQISLNQAHQGAIEDDLVKLSEDLGIDIACVFGQSDLPASMNHDVKLTVSAPKMLPRYLTSITSTVFSAGGNILRFNRISLSPMVIEVEISGASASALQEAISSLELEPDLKISLT
jgi:phosphoserine phosphatase